jgi:hypothetical protein
MSDAERALRRCSVQLLLEILELPEPALSGVAADALGGDGARDLLGLGLLKPSGHEAIAASTADHDDAPVTLSWSPESGGYGYFSPTAGWVTIRAEQVARYAADVDAILGGLTSQVHRLGRDGPRPIVRDLVWDLGAFRLGRGPQHTSIWFGRRLFDREAWRQLREAAHARPAPRVRIVLTSTTARRLTGAALAGHHLIPLEELIGGDRGMTLDPEVLLARVSGTGSPDIAEPLYLSPDGRRLVINGGVAIDLKSAIHIAIIRKLVEGHRAGRRYGAREVLEIAGSSAMSFARAFREPLWPLLRPYLKSRNGLWGFEL